METKALVSKEEAVNLYPSLSSMNDVDLGAALLRASIYVMSQAVIPEPTPSDVQLAICMMVDIDKAGPAVKEVARSDYKEVYDTKDRRWDMIENIISAYAPKTETESEFEVRFL